MIMQKKGFLLFLCSLIPGAGELYMGFKKRGVSMMAIFWGIVALACVSGLEWFALALPVVWAYSFFQVHNLKSLPEVRKRSARNCIIWVFLCVPTGTL